MTTNVYPSGSTLSTPEREEHNATRLMFRLCAMDDAHRDDLPFADVLATLTSPAHGSHDYPRGRWQSGIPLCRPCANRFEEGLPFGHFLVDAVLPKLCPECGLLAPCTSCADPQS